MCLHSTGMISVQNSRPLIDLSACCLNTIKIQSAARYDVALAWRTTLRSPGCSLEDEESGRELSPASLSERVMERGSENGPLNG